VNVATRKRVATFTYPARYFIVLLQSLTDVESSINRNRAVLFLFNKKNGKARQKKGKRTVKERLITKMRMTLSIY